MTWVTPLAWLGAGLLVLPVLVHLLSRQRPPVELAPTLRFLAPTPPLSVRRSRLKDPGLLTLRVLAILAAVAALARPSMESAAPLEAEGVPETRVALVDGFPAGGASSPALLEEARASALAWVEGGEVHEVDAAGGSALWHAVEAAVAHLDALPGRHAMLVLSDFRLGQLPALGERPLPPGPTRVELRRVGGPPPAEGVEVRRETRIPLMGMGGADAGPGRAQLRIQTEPAPPWLEGGVSASWQREEATRGPTELEGPPPPGGRAAASPELLRAAELLGLPATEVEPGQGGDSVAGGRALRDRQLDLDVDLDVDLDLALARDPELQAVLKGEAGGGTPASAGGLEALATLAVRGRVDQGLPWRLDALDPRWHTAEELEVRSMREPAEVDGHREPDPEEGRREARVLWLLALLLLGAEWGVRRRLDRAGVKRSDDGGSPP